jgi:Flp pilus assembly protein TadG
LELRMERLTRFARRHQGGERGVAAVEFALVAPILLLLVFGIIDFGLGFHAWDASENAAREGARVGAVDPSVADIEARVRATSSFLDQTNLSVDITCSRDNGRVFHPCPNGSTWLEGDIVRVKVTYVHDYVTPLPGAIGAGQTLTISTAAEARFEGQ